MTGFDIERTARAGFLLAVAGALFWLLLTPGSASAHANLARSEPAGNEVLKEAPERIVVWFTEEIEPAFSKIEVLDSNGSRVDNGGSTVDSNNLKVMSVSLPPIPNGSYTVAWKNVSTVDGHRVRGSFVFSVGEALAPGIAAPAERPLLESAAEPFARWLMLGGALALAGGLLFALVVAAPGIEASHCGPRLSALLYGRWWVVTWAGAGAFAGGSLAQLVVQSSSFAEVGVVEALGGPAFTVLADTTWGRLWLLRALALAAVAAVLAVAYVRTGAGRQPSTRLLLAAGLPSAMLMLLSLSLASHAAGTSAIRGPATLTDYIHLLASAAWAGGLMHFAAVVPVVLSPNPPKDTDGRREDSGRVGEGATGEMAGLIGVDWRSANGLQSPHRAPMALCGSCDARDGERIRSRELSRTGVARVCREVGSVAGWQSGGEWNGSQPGHGASELGFPRPMLGKMQGKAARRAGDPSHQSEDPPPKGLGGHGPFGQTDARCPAGEVVCHHLHRQPGAVGGEAPRGEMVESDARVSGLESAFSISAWRR